MQISTRIKFLSVWHQSFARKPYLTCRKKQNAPGIEVLNFSKMFIFHK